MSKNKSKLATPKKILMSSYGLDEASSNVLLDHLHKENFVLTVEDNELYTTDNNNGFKIPVSKYGYVLTKIKELTNFIEGENNNNLLMHYLYEKIKMLEDKISDLEKENDDLKDRLK